MTYTCNTAYGLTSIKHRALQNVEIKNNPKPFEFTGDIFRGCQCIRRASDDSI